MTKTIDFYFDFISPYSYLAHKQIQKKNNSQILVTTGTKSSSKLIFKRLNKSITHQFLPLDNPIFVERFLSYWKPNIGIFVESEIWPNLILKSKNKKIKLVIINGRMTPKTYKKAHHSLASAPLLSGKLHVILIRNSPNKNNRIDKQDFVLLRKKPKKTLLG